MSSPTIGAPPMGYSGRPPRHDGPSTTKIKIRRGRDPLIIVKKPNPSPPLPYGIAGPKTAGRKRKSRSLRRQTLRRRRS